MPTAKSNTRGRVRSTRKRTGKLFFNQDDTQSYYWPAAGKMTTGHLDRIVDGLANTDVRVLLLCVNGKKTFFPSKSWEPYCEGYDPEGGPGQPFLGGDKDPWYARCAMNMLTLFRQGVDPPAYMLARARTHGLKVWISMRMNDGHARGLPDHPLNSRFYREHPKYLTPNNTLGKAWDYALQPVRDHMMALIREIVGHFSLDGLDLDWLRSPNHFRDGHFDEGRPILTEWIGKVRQAVDAGAKKRGRKIVLTTRVPARPEIARGIGLDAVEWAKRGFIDRLIVGPYKGTTDFDVPVEEWKRLLKGTGVPVTVSLEHVVSFFPGAPNCWSGRFCMTREQLRGAAIGALHRGSDGVYLFNHMERYLDDPDLFRELGSVAALEDKDRDYLQTWVSPEIPEQPLQHELPRMVAPGAAASFRLYTGPKMRPRARTAVHLTISDADAQAFSRVAVAVSGARANLSATGKSFILPGDDRISFAFDRASCGDGYTQVSVANHAERALKITGVELTVRFPQ